MFGRKKKVTYLLPTGRRPESRGSQCATYEFEDPEMALEYEQNLHDAVMALPELSDEKDPNYQPPPKKKDKKGKGTQK